MRPVHLSNIRQLTHGTIRTFWSDSVGSHVTPFPFKTRTPRAINSSARLRGATVAHSEPNWPVTQWSRFVIVHGKLLGNLTTKTYIERMIIGVGRTATPSLSLCLSTLIVPTVIGGGPQRR